MEGALHSHGKASEHLLQDLIRQVLARPGPGGLQSHPFRPDRPDEQKLEEKNAAETRHHLRVASPCQSGWGGGGGRKTFFNNSNFSPVNYFFFSQANEKLKAVEYQQQTCSPQSWLGIRGGGAPPGKLSKHSVSTLLQPSDEEQPPQDSGTIRAVRRLKPRRLGTSPAALRRCVRKSRPLSSSAQDA